MDQQSRNRSVMLGVVLVFLVFFVRDTRIGEAPSVNDGAALFATKYISIARWIPDDVDLSVVVDLPRALATSSVARGVDWLLALDPQKFEVLREFVKGTPSVETTLIVLEFSDNKDADIALVMQGNFQGDALVDYVRKELMSAGGSLEQGRLQNIPIYIEKGETNPFAFSLFNSRTLAMGTPAFLERLIQMGSQSSIAKRIIPDVLFLGRLRIGSEMKAVLPQQFSDLTEIFFSSVDGALLHITLPCESLMKVMERKLYIEGFKTFVALEREERSEIRAALEKIHISSEENLLVIDIDVETMLKVFTVPTTANRP